jgi:hypothetical protein
MTVLTRSLEQVRAGMSAVVVSGEHCGRSCVVIATFSSTNEANVFFGDEITPTLLNGNQLSVSNKARRSAARRNRYGV